MNNPAPSNGPQSVSGQAISWRGFHSPELEAEYRQHQLAYDRAHGRLFAWLLLIGNVTFAASDYRLFGWSAPFAGLAVMRVTTVLACVMALRLQRSASPRDHDRLQFMLALLGAVAAVIATSTRPAGYFTHSIVTIGLAFSFYFVVPLAWPRQLIAAFIACAGDLAYSWAGMPSDRLTLTAIATSFTLANFVGVYASRELDRWKRRQFVALRSETLLRDQLERALAAIRTLEGILPICSHCKNVRDDVGSWHPLDEYVRDHTDAEFTHGLCPTCLSRHYAEFQDT